MGRFSYPEDITRADLAVEAEAESLDDLFATAARALAEAMADPATLPADRERTVELEAPELDLLLHEFLSELIFRKDTGREIYPHADVEVSGEGPYRLTARLRGGSLEEPGAAERADLKAVTFHRYELEQVPHGWRARFVVDV